MFESGFERACLVCIALLAATACGRSRRVYVARAAEPSTRVVRIGAFASVTGRDAAIGADYQRGFESAIEKWNSDTTKRVRVQLVSYDDQSRPSASAAAVQRLVVDDRVVIVASPGHQRLDQKQATPEPLIACASCPENSTESVIGLAPSYAERAEMLAELVVKTMKMNKVAILARADVASDRAAGDAFRASLKTRGVATDEALLFTPETIADVLARLTSDAPQAVLVAMDGTEAALVGRAMRRRALPSALLFFGTPNLAVLPEADRTAALEGAFFPGCSSNNESGWVIGDVGYERGVLGFEAMWRICMALEASGNEAAQSLRSSLARVPSGTILAVGRVERGRCGPFSP